MPVVPERADRSAEVEALVEEREGAAAPVDIERALNGDYSQDKGKRDRQLEAKAHVVVQRRIDAGGLTGRAGTAEAIREVHRRFYELLPDDLLWVEHPVDR